MVPPHPCQAWCTQVALCHRGSPVPRVTVPVPCLAVPCPCPMPCPGFPSFHAPLALPQPRGALHSRAGGLGTALSTSRGHSQAGCQAHALPFLQNFISAPRLPEQSHSQHKQTQEADRSASAAAGKLLWPCQKQCQGEGVRRMAARKRWRSGWKRNPHSAVSS